MQSRSLCAVARLESQTLQSLILRRPPCLCVTTLTTGIGRRTRAFASRSSSAQVKKSPVLLLVDGHSLAHRCYWALVHTDGSGLRTADGIPTSITFGFLKSLQAVFGKERPDAVAVAFDAGKSFRRFLSHQFHESGGQHVPAGLDSAGVLMLLADVNDGSSAALPKCEYKKGRETPPPDFYEDLANLQAILQALRVPMITAPPFEADDVIATLVARARQDSCRVKILSGDKDLFQLVDDAAGISVLYPGSSRPGTAKNAYDELDEAGIIAKMGLSPAQIVDFKAMCGDPSDGLQGVRGVGQKTALDLLQRYHTLDEVYNHLQDLRPRQRDLLTEGRASAYHTQMMVRVRDDAILQGFDGGTWRDCQVQGYDEAEVLPLLYRLQLGDRMAPLLAHLQRPDAASSTRGAAAPPSQVASPAGGGTHSQQPPAGQQAALGTQQLSVSLAIKQQQQPPPSPPSSPIHVHQVASSAHLDSLLQQCRKDLSSATATSTGAALVLHVEVAAGAQVDERPSVAATSTSTDGTTSRKLPLPSASSVVLCWPSPATSAAATNGTSSTGVSTQVINVAELSAASMSAWSRSAAHVGASSPSQSAQQQQQQQQEDTLSGVMLEAALRRLSAVLGDAHVPKCVHDAKAWHRWCLQAGVPLNGVRSDTLMMAYLLNPEGGGIGADKAADAGRAAGTASRTRWRQDAVAQRYGLPPQAVVSQQLPTESVSSASSGLLPAAAAVQLQQLSMVLTEQMAQAPPALRRLFDEVELPLQAVLAGMELAGVRVDQHALTQLQTSLQQQLAQVEDQCCVAAGEVFNLRSPQQLAGVLFDKLKLTAGKKTAGGSRRSTSVEVLQDLKDNHPLVPLVMQFRELDRVASAYVHPFIQALVADGTGHIHTTYDSAGTVSGRLSSHDPNLQNLPKHVRRNHSSGYGQQLRRTFIPQAGWSFMAFDYSQIELRLAAHLSGDARLVDAFRSGTDLHTNTAAAVLSKKPEEVTSTERQLGKAVNFGVLYGEGSSALAKRISVSQAKAKAYLASYKAQHPQLFDFIERQHKSAVEEGSVSTLMGRRRLFSIHLPDDKALREAGNMPMQGSAADVLKASMVAVASWLQKQQLAARLLLTIHDELILEVPPSEREGLAKGVAAIMEAAAGQLTVPLVVDVSEGTNLMDLTPYRHDG